jgi:hypothetical protein
LIAVKMARARETDYTDSMRRTVALMLSFLLTALPLAGTAAFSTPVDDQACEHAEMTAMDCCQSGDHNAPSRCNCAPGATCVAGSATVFWAAPSSLVTTSDTTRDGIVPDRATVFFSLVLAVPLRPPVAGL